MQPSGPSNPLVLQMYKASAHGSYSALSYAWGDKSLTDKAIVPDVEFTITLNLALALRRLRQLDECRRPLTIWIDRFCIDQLDEDRQREQLGRSTEIFTAAKTTYIWLGAGTPESQEDFEFLYQITQEGWSIEQQFDDAVIDRWRPVMKGIAQRFFFTRVWIVQELVLAQNPIVLCGGAQVPWSLIAEKLWLLEDANLMSGVDYNLRRRSDNSHGEETRRDFMSPYRQVPCMLDAFRRQRTAAGQNDLHFWLAIVGN